MYGAMVEIKDIIWPMLAYYACFIHIFPLTTNKVKISMRLPFM
jgi:hypothetical protein